MATKKTSYLFTLPYLFARLEFPGVAQETLQIFDTKPESDWDNWSIMFLSRTTPSLRQDVLNIDAQGGNVSNKVQLQVEKLKSIPMYHNIKSRLWEDCYCLKTLFLLSL